MAAAVTNWFELPTTKVSKVYFGSNEEETVSEELSFDEVASITDAFYVNGVPGEVESFAYDLIEDEMRKFGFRTKFVHFN